MKHLKWLGFGLLFGLGCGAAPESPGTDSGVAVDAQEVGSSDAPAVDTLAVDSVDVLLPDGQVSERADSGQMTTCGTVLGGPCDPVSGRGCAAGQGCYLRMAMGGNPMGSCETAGGGEWDARCSTNTDCREGFACLPTAIGGMTRACTRLCCEGDNAACRDEPRGGMPGAVCDRGLILNGTMIHICQAPTRCDPQALMANGCPMDRGYCNVLSMDGTTACSPLSARPGGEGELCCTEGCQAGYICVGTAGTCDMSHPIRTCRRVCNPMTSGSDGGVVCPTMQTCLGLMGRPASLGSCAQRM